MAISKDVHEPENFGGMEPGSSNARAVRNETVDTTAPAPAPTADTVRPASVEASEPASAPAVRRAAKAKPARKSKTR